MLKSIVLFLFAMLIVACSSQPMTPKEEQKELAEQIERCKKLKREMDDLRGKPVRRNAAIEYYNNECGYNPERGVN